MKAQPSIRIWDPVVRVCHWCVIAGFAVAYMTQERDYELHLLSGYVVFGLVVTRALWGFIGTRPARFANFVRGPAVTLRYLRDIARGEPQRHLGHNPAGGAMAVLLLLTLVVISVSGVALDAAENRAGPLARFRLFLYTDLIESIHELSSHACIALIITHVAGVLITSRQHRENLVAAMITGRKHPGEDTRDIS